MPKEYVMSEEEKRLRKKLGLPLEPVFSGKPKSLEETFAHHCSPIGEGFPSLGGVDSKPKKDSEH